MLNAESKLLKLIEKLIKIDISIVIDPLCYKLFLFIIYYYNKITKLLILVLILLMLRTKISHFL